MSIAFNVEDLIPVNLTIVDMGPGAAIIRNCVCIQHLVLIFSRTTLKMGTKGGNRRNGYDDQRLPVGGQGIKGLADAVLI